jgi:cell division protein ZapA (FtsZ GTPase activity inhibitor)
LKDNIVEIQILGQKLVLKSDEKEEYVREVENYLNGKIEDIKESTKAVSTLDLALLTALNLTGEFLRTKQMLERVEKRSEELIQLIDRRLF